MDQQTNKQEPSGTEGGQVKAGDKVWVLCEVVMVYKDQDFPYVDVEHDGTVFQAIKKQCRPVEPQAKQPTQGQKLAEQALKGIWAANDAVNGTPVKEPAAKKYREPTLVDLNNGPIDCEVRDYHDEPWKSGVLVCVHNSRAWRFQAQPQTRSYVYAPHWNQCRIAVPVEPIPEPAIKESLATESNCSEIPNSSSEPLLLGDAVELQSNNVWRGTKGILTNWCPIKKAFWFESLDLSRKAISGWMKEQWDDEETGVCRLVKIDHPNDSPKPHSSSEPIREAFERSMAERYDWYQGYFSRNEDRYFDSSVEMAWQAFRAGAKYGDPRGCPETTDKEPQCEKDLWWGPVSDPVNPSHYKQGGIECIEAIKAATGEGFTGYVWGNVLKYLWRWPKKGGVEDLKKARWYLDRLIKEVGE